MHGGAFGSGAPKGNNNALKHGFYTRQALEERKKWSKWIQQMEEKLRQMK
jgi:uncharacterized protein YjcR